MAATRTAHDFTAIPAPKTAAKAAPKAAAKPATTPGFFSRMFQVMTAARLRQAEREVARYLADTGGKFTDEAEREIERRFLSNQSRW
jgi:hypothetical protein